MKKNYIQPNVSVSFVVVESLLQAVSGGTEFGPGENCGGFSKPHEFTDDSFDTAWPKDKSPWD